MYGRYGTDQLNRFLSFAALILLIIGLFVRASLLDLVALILLFVIYFRMLSRNTSKRYAENERFLRLAEKVTGGRFGGSSGGSRSFGGGQTKTRKSDRRAEWEQRRIYRFYSCPHCAQRVRVPRGKGKICITCPKCRTEFIKHT